jgi:hypothetical protein
MAVRTATHALDRPVPYLLEQGYRDVAGTGGQTLSAPIRQTSDGELVAVDAAGSTVTITGPDGVPFVSAGAVSVSGGVASYTFAAGSPGTTYSLGEGWTVVWALNIGGELYTFRQSAILCQYVPHNVITAADLYGGDGVPELRYKVPQAQQEGRGDGTEWGPQIDAAYYDFLRKMLSDGRPIWLSREPTGYRDWVLAKALLRAVDSIPAQVGTVWDQEKRAAYRRFREADTNLRLQYDTESSSIRRPGTGPVYLSPVGRPRW